jgi:hypothetical protein
LSHATGIAIKLFLLLLALNLVQDAGMLEKYPPVSCLKGPLWVVEDASPVTEKKCDSHDGEVQRAAVLPDTGTGLPENEQRCDWVFNKATREHRLQIV